MDVNHQLTITEYLDYKENLQRELNNLANGFVKTGYYLKRIRDTEAYSNDGYNSVYEFAEKEYGITRTVASRFMSINDKFSEDGYSLELKEQYKGLGSSRLSEMLSLPEEDHAMISNVTKIEDIRELKRFEKEEHTEESTMEDLLRQFFLDTPERLEAVMTKECIKDIAEIVNPSGNKSFRYKIDFMMMYEYEKGIDIRNFHTGMHHMSWEEFVAECKKVFVYDPEAAGTVYEQNYQKKEVIEEKKTVEAEETKNIDKVSKSETGKTIESESNLKTKKEVEEKEEKYKDSVTDNEENKEIVSEREENAKEEVEEEPKAEVEDKPAEVCTEEKAEVVEGEVENGVCDIAQEDSIVHLDLEEYRAIAKNTKRFLICRNTLVVGDIVTIRVKFNRAFSDIHAKVVYREQNEALSQGYMAYGIEVVDEAE